MPVYLESWMQTQSKDEIYLQQFLLDKVLDKLHSTKFMRNEYSLVYSPTLSQKTISTYTLENCP